MRKLGPVQNVLHATVNLGAHVETGTNNIESAKKGMWGKIWNERDVQIMVVISLALQLFLLFAGNVRRRRRVGWLRSLVWLAYLSSYTVAASAIGLFSQYEDKYKLRSAESSSEHLHTMMMPFLWAPFLLLHLGGPDTISAFSIEDNNLWTRQLINLAFQLSLALYVFWKSYDLLDSQLLAVAVPLFVAGIIKYGERIWALKSSSRDSLDRHTKKEDLIITDHFTHPSASGGTQPGGTTQPAASGGARQPECAVEFRALNSARCFRGLLVGRTLLQLGTLPGIKVQEALGGSNKSVEDKLKFVLTELGMMYDMLYTKAMVLQSWTGIFVRCVALLAMVVAFVLFWVNQHLHAHRTINAAITYTLFVGAMFVEVFSIFMVAASPWTRARSKQGRFLSWLSGCLPCQRFPSPSMGQFNLVDYCLSKKSTPKFIFKVSEATGLEKHWRNFRQVKHVEDEAIRKYIVGLFITGFKEETINHELMFVLNLPFEHALFRLHIFTEMHLIKVEDDTSVRGEALIRTRKLVAECRKLSQYLMYLMAVHPSMLSVDIAAKDLEFGFVDWIREETTENKKKELDDLAKNSTNQDKDAKRVAKAEIVKRYAEKVSKEVILENYANAKFYTQNCKYPFKETVSEASLKEVKEVWARLLIYAAGKCRMELHARQLGNGVELLTVVGTLMVHHCLGDVGRKINLLSYSKTMLGIAPYGQSIYSIPLEVPHYAFSYVEPQPPHVQVQQSNVQAQQSNEHGEQSNVQPVPGELPIRPARLHRYSRGRSGKLAGPSPMQEIGRRDNPAEAERIMATQLTVTSV